jgi:hypothetical protein
LTEAQVAGIKSMLDTLAAGTDAAATWLKGQTGTLSVVIGSGYGCTDTTLTIPANFASDASLDASVKAAVESAVPCPCQAGTMREFSDSPACCTSGDCTCSVQQTHNLSLGTHPVVLTVPAYGISQDRFTELQEDFTAAAVILNSIGGAWYNGNTDTVEIELKDSGEYEYISKYKFRMNKSAIVLDTIVDHILFHNSLGFFKQFDTSKATVRLAYAPFGKADIEEFAKDVVSQVSQLIGAQG